MALKMSVNLDNGLIVQSAYIKIEQISLNMQIATLLVGIFANDNANDAVSRKIYCFTPDLSDDAKNIYVQSYDYLKSHSDFKTAVDSM